MSLLLLLVTSCASNIVPNEMIAFYSIHVKTDKPASIVLLWKSRRTPKHKVPTSRLFPWADPIDGSPFKIRVIK